MIKDRFTQVENLLEACNVDAFVFFHLPNIRYLCGFSGSDGVLVVSREASCFLTDSRYTSQAGQEVSADQIREHRGKLEGILACIGDFGCRRVGFESEVVPFATIEQLKEKGSDEIEWVPVRAEVTRLRGVKDAVEIDALNEAAQLNAEAFETVLPLIRPGACERDIALALEFELKRRGGEEKAFDFIVASGPRGALPHGVASSRQICAGDLVTVDFGTRVRGYHSDETVTLAVGEVSDRLREIYDTVLEAHDRAIALVSPGVPLKEVDAAARDYIADKGFGEFFGHGTGHGVGLEVHEFPVVSGKSSDAAREGMIFTVEPGIYIPDLGGVRIEDTLEVTSDGCRRITRIPKEFRTLPA